MTGFRVGLEVGLTGRAKSYRSIAELILPTVVFGPSEGIARIPRRDKDSLLKNKYLTHNNCPEPVCPS